jgi:enoyl-CoA hydratase/carnithine racemase
VRLAPRSYGEDMSFTEITYEVEGPAAIITLNRPERLNAFTGTMMQEMIDAFDRADADDAVRAVIVTGAGRGFCAGADLGAGGDTFNYEARGTAPAEPERAPRDGGGVLVLRIFDSKKPVIGAINGSAVGVGLTMTLPMDVRFLADNAKLGFVFAGRGIAPDGAASWFLPRIVGISQALEWVLTARVFNAQEALEAGLVKQVLPADQVLDAAKALVQEIANGAAPVSAVVSRGLLWRMLGADHPMAAHRADSAAIFELGRKADSKEGVMAFLEKRTPDWKLKPSQDLPSSYPYWDSPTYEGE